MLRVLLACLLWMGVVVAAPAATLIVLGDSISAAYGMPTDKGWVKLLEQRLAAKYPDWQVVNASISGDTTAGGLSRLPQLLRTHRPGLVVIELGGNDGLRGVALKTTRSNLQQMVRMTRASGAQVLLLGMEIPPNYGPQYTAEFRDVYRKVALAEKVGLLPFFLDGVATNSNLMQSDGIHPNRFAQQKMLDNAWPLIEGLLK